ncbi:unnamed protein product [Callosobruchus maculatus]|uniref:Uncharacterized protein n=1 Tax=Callosobruchus maculatus TaxID=64391 RepID=A0A653DBC3_CALMS|nr:unnamed protein product [Callosobruchus maculatus]
MVLSPKEGAKIVASKAKHVKIEEKALRNWEIVLKLQSSGSSSFFRRALGFGLVICSRYSILFLHNENEEGWKVEGHSGYFALCAAINRAIKEKGIARVFRKKVWSSGRTPVSTTETRRLEFSVGKIEQYSTWLPNLNTGAIIYHIAFLKLGCGLDHRN